MKNLNVNSVYYSAIVFKMGFIRGKSKELK